jgi:chromosome transmission fidelity protein 18
LAEATGGDIRSCISTLQFLSRKKTAASITVQDIHNSSVGVKDKVVDVKTVWTKVFHQPRAKRRGQGVLDLA